MLGINNYKAELSGLNLVKIEDIGIGTFKGTEKFFIKVSKGDKVQTVYNSINTECKNYVIAQVLNLARQLRLPDIEGEQNIYDAMKGKEAEIEFQENGFHINSYRTISEYPEASEEAADC